jgi:hypothetical protein
MTPVLRRLPSGCVVGADRVLVGDPFHCPIRNRSSIDGFREAPIIDRFGNRPAQQLWRCHDRAAEQIDIR